MKQEQVLLASLTKAARAVGLPNTTDARGKLKTYPAAKKWKLRDVDALEGMVWHQELAWGSVESVAEYHTGKQSHLAKGGVRSIAYTFAIRRNGQIVLCNDFDQAVWSQGYKGRPGDENVEFLSVMFEGFFKGPNVSDPSAGHPNDRQLLAGLSLWSMCKAEWGWDSGALYGHFHFGKPACPGTALQAIIETIRATPDAPDHDFSTVAGRQQALTDLGYNPGAIDAVWGPTSRGALTRFQEDHALAVDGIWGPATEKAISEALEQEHA
jgi:hypothetical protein